VDEMMDETTFEVTLIFIQGADIAKPLKANLPKLRKSLIQIYSWLVLTLTSSGR